MSKVQYIGAIHKMNAHRISQAQINERVAERNVPSTPLQAQFTPRGVSTKYAHMPLFDRRPKSTVPIILRPTHDVAQTFNPGTAQGPWAGFANKVNDESRLRNQFFALQKADQACFVPATNSDLYAHRVHDEQPNQQLYPRLFERPMFAPFNPNEFGIGGQLFANHTRQQVKEYVPPQPPPKEDTE